MTVSRERVRLANHAGVSGTTIHGWPAFFFGLPFIASWLVIRLGMTGVIGGIQPSRGIPPLLVNSCAWMFGIAGFYFCVLGLEGVLRARRHRAVAAAHPDRPWLADHDWDRSSVSDDTWRRVRRALFGMAMFTAILGPLVYLAFFHKEGSIIFQIVSSLFGLVWVYATWHTATLCLRALRIGTGRAHFREFPYFLGDRMRATVELPTDVRALDRLEITPPAHRRRSPPRGGLRSPARRRADVTPLTPRALLGTRNQRRAPRPRPPLGLHASGLRAGFSARVGFSGFAARALASSGASRTGATAGIRNATTPRGGSVSSSESA